jgi:hypothetical protein
MENGKKESSVLTDSDKEIILNYYTNKYILMYENATNIFNAKDTKKFAGIEFLTMTPVYIDLGEETCIESIMSHIDDVRKSLSANQVCGSHSISIDIVTETVSLYIAIWELRDRSEIVKKVNSTIAYIVSDFEFKYKHQRNGKDVLRHLNFFKALGIKINADE